MERHGGREESSPDAARGEDGTGCLNLANEKSCAEAAGSDSDSDSCKTAPVCGYLGNVENGKGQTLDPNAALVSTFSFENARLYPISSTDCSKQLELLYAGCMTAACGESF